MKLRPDQDELAQLAEFQSRHRASLLCLVYIEVAGVAKLKQQMGDAGALRLLNQHEQILRDLLASFPGGLEVSSVNGSFFLVFEKPSDAVRFALELRSRARLLGRKLGQSIEERTGIHVGEVLVEVPQGEGRVRNLNGVHVDIGQAVLSLAGPGQVLLTRFAYESARQALKAATLASGAERVWTAHGAYQIEGADDPVEICEVSEPGEPPPRIPRDSSLARRLAGEPDLTEITPDLSGTTFLRRVRHASAPERKAALLGALSVSILGLAMVLGGWLDAASYDLAYLFKRAQPVEDVLIIGMDDTSHRDLAQRPDALWDRALHTRLIDRLTRAGAKAVAFDVLFDSPSAIEMERPTFVESPIDRSLRQAMETNARVVIGAKHKPDGVSAPSPLFRKAARWGLVEIASGTSTIRTRVSGTAQVPPFVEQVARATGLEPRATPGKSWIRYYGPPGTIPTVSYLSALSTNEVPDSVFSNKVVFIGEAATMPPARDEFTTPYSRWREARINGVEVNATSYLNLVRGEPLRRLPSVAELLLVCLAGAGISYAFTFFEPPKAVAIGLAGTLLLGVGFAVQVWFTGIWFPWMVPAAAQIPAAVVWSVVVRTRLLTDEERRLRKALKSRRPAPAAEAGESRIPAEGTRVMNADEHARAAGRAAAASTVPPIPDHSMVRAIGKGAYGEVWLAEDIIGKPKAVKLIRRAAFADAGPFEREFKGLQKYTPISRSHPGLVHILHIGRNDAAGFIYYIMEAGDDALTGPAIDPGSYNPRNLGTDIEARGALPLAEVLQLGIEIAEALAHLHRQGLIHRDIKPGNIIFVNGRPKLADIGLVTDIAAPGQEITFVGTHGYMPADGPGEPSADVFSLGKLLYVALTGLPVSKFPDVPDPVLQSPQAELTAEFLMLLLRACEGLRSARYPDADSFAADLRDLRQRLS
jgi:CHASE2 domain-containing sensor protein/class 3 adenylate cyclase